MSDEDAAAPGQDFLAAAEQRRWDIPGSAWCYRTDLELDGQPKISFSMLVPSLDGSHIAAARVNRIGGPNLRDWQFRSQLYPLIGRITVLGGQIESAMKRLVILTHGDTNAAFSTVDWNWTKLHADLRHQADTVGPPGNTLAQAHDWAEEKRLKTHRDDVVHASWWDYADVSVQRGRFHRRSDGATIFGTLDDLAKVATDMAIYAAMLDEVIGDHWLSVYLPRDLEDQLILDRKQAPGSESE